MQYGNSLPISYLIMSIDLPDLGKHIDEYINMFVFKIGCKYSIVF